MNELIGIGRNGAVEDVVDEAPLYLRDLDFTDIYISESGLARIRGLQDEDGPYVEVTSEMVADIDSLARRVIHKGQTEDEFALDFDSIRYRAAKMHAQTESWYALRRLMHPVPRFPSFMFSRGVNMALGRIPGVPGKGLILVAGATGNGKTTTVSSLMLEYLIRRGEVGVTIEDPPELKLEGRHGPYGECFQLKVEDGDFSTPLRKAFRYNPRYILLGEIRDPDAATEALRAAISGHVVLATVHAGSIIEAVSSMLKLVSSKLDQDLARSMMADGLVAVLHQQLKVIKVDERSERRPFLRTLFLHGAGGARAKIRDGNINQLASDIEQQEKRIILGHPPVEDQGGITR